MGSFQWLFALKPTVSELKAFITSIWKLAAWTRMNLQTSYHPLRLTNFDVLNLYILYFSFLRRVIEVTFFSQTHGFGAKGFYNLHFKVCDIELVRSKLHACTTLKFPSDFLFFLLSRKKWQSRCWMARTCGINYSPGGMFFVGISRYVFHCCTATWFTPTQSCNVWLSTLSPWWSCRS